MENPKQRNQPAGKLAGLQNYRVAPSARSARAKRNSGRGWRGIAVWVAIALGTTFICRWWLNHYAPWGKVSGFACGQSGACQLAFGFGGLAVLLATSIWLLLVGVKKAAGPKAARMTLLVILNLVGVVVALVLLYFVLWGVNLNHAFWGGIKYPIWTPPAILVAAYAGWFAWRYRRRQKISGAHESAGRS